VGNNLDQILVYDVANETFVELKESRKEKEDQATILMCKKTAQK
jgi:hypothetical protein